jgi:adenylate cyclase
MGIEIERKFLLKDDSWRQVADAGTRYVQGYINGSANASVRVRIEGQHAKLNIKSARLGMRRQEFEYEIPLADAQVMLDDLCEKPLIDKVRYLVDVHGRHWEIDVFNGDNAGLVVAEIELQSEHDTVVLPAWAGKEVTDDPRYYNVSLVRHPYKDWQ